MMTINTFTTIRPEDEQLGMTKNVAYGLQHVLTMYGGIIAVPLIIGSAVGLKSAEIGTLIAASLFVGGFWKMARLFGKTCSQLSSLWKNSYETLNLAILRFFMLRYLTTRTQVLIISLILLNLSLTCLKMMKMISKLYKMMLREHLRRRFWIVSLEKSIIDLGELPSIEQNELDDKHF